MSKLELEDLCKGCGFYDVCKTKNEKNILKNEIRELKTLLKDCRSVVDWVLKNTGFEDTKLLKRIDNAIGEKR